LEADIHPAAGIIVDDEIRTDQNHRDAAIVLAGTLREDDPVVVQRRLAFERVCWSPLPQNGRSAGSRNDNRLGLVCNIADGRSGEVPCRD